MNFIGHATVALWKRSEPTFVLGSMLPDFATMAGARLANAAAEDEPLACGIALHHQTDALFHSAPAFTRLMQEAMDELTSLEVSRGPARAVGHIGVEMLLDGELIRMDDVAQAYVRALEAGGDARVPFRNEEDSARFQQLRRRLLAFGPPYDYRNPDAVVARLMQVLRGRPRLALDASSAELVRRVLPGLQRKVVVALPALLADLRTALR